MTEISIVVTVKNEAENIVNLLDSISKLEFEGELETIIVDGGSTDNTLQIVSRYPFVKLVTSNCNVSEGRNIGIKKSTGRIIAFTDGDCVVDKYWIKNILRHFDTNIDVGVVGGPYLPCDQKELISQYMSAYVGAFFPSKTGFTNPHSIGTGNASYRREVLEKIGGFNEKLAIGEDLDLNERISKIGYKLLFAQDVKIYHRYRSLFKEASRWAFEHGKAFSAFNSIRKRYRILFFPYMRTAFLLWGILLILGALTDNITLIYIDLLLFVFYYFYRLIRVHEKRQYTNISSRWMFLIPIIDIYVRLLESCGSVYHMASNFCSTFKKKFSSLFARV